MNSIGKVSFGQLYTVKENFTRTEKQRKIEDKVNDVFESRSKRNGTEGCTGRTLSEMLEEDMRVDVKLTHKKNGNVELALEEKESEFDLPILENMVKGKDKIKLTLDKNLSQREIGKKLTVFAAKCRSLAEYYNKEMPNIFARRVEKLSPEVRERILGI